MTNVSSTPQKVATRRGLFAFAQEALENEGWTVSRVARGGKASLREISRNGQRHRVSIRTSQDAWIAFPPKTKGSGWVTLDDVDYVVASSVNDRDNPSIARVHMIPGDVARAAFDRAFAARKAAGYTLPAGRGIWLSLYEREADSPVTLVGAGLGLDHAAIATRDLTREPLLAEAGDDDEPVDEQADPEPLSAASLTISEAKRLLALGLGVPEASVRIVIEH
jgi:hypothetical protein